MTQAVCLDGVHVDLDVDRIDVDLTIPGLRTVYEEAAWDRCPEGEAMEPVARFEDGTTIFFHCAPEGEPDYRGYRVESARPHRWAIELKEEQAPQQRLRVAMLHVDLG